MQTRLAALAVIVGLAGAAGYATEPNAAGERGYYQQVPIRALRLNTGGSSLQLTRGGRT